MYIESKTVIKNNKEISVKIKVLNYSETLFGLVVNDKIVKTGNAKLIFKAYDNF